MKIPKDYKRNPADYGGDPIQPSRTPLGYFEDEDEDLDDEGNVDVEWFPLPAALDEDDEAEAETVEPPDEE